MRDREYTVSELGALRRAIENKYLWGSYGGSGGHGSSRPYKELEKSVIVEDQVRTHMLAGHTAAELIASELPSAPE